mgnify:CR=1 FL=1
MAHELGERTTDKANTQPSRPNQPIETMATPAAKPTSPIITIGIISVAVNTTEIAVQMEPRITKYERSDSISGAAWCFMRPNAGVQGHLKLNSGLA